MGSEEKMTSFVARKFGLVFALILAGSAYAHADQTSHILTIEAEGAAIRTIGSPIENGWNLWSNGQVGDYLKFEQSGRYQITISAYGSPLQGVWPLMNVLVGAEATAAVSVNTPQWAEYRFTVEIARGIWAVAAAFTNDAYQPPEDRNLYLDKLVISTPAGLTPPVPVTREEWKTECEKREKEILDRAAREIEKNRKGMATIRVVDKTNRPVKGCQVTAEQISHDFLFGCNIFRFDRFDHDEKNRVYKNLFQELFNYATTGFYWSAYEPKPGKPDYGYTDRLVQWCRENNIRLKGHPLLWAYKPTIPAWSHGLPSEEVQKKRVFDILQRYRGKIEFWEVVNEPAHLQELKIDAPYRWARAADPQAYLIVNDFSVLGDSCPAFFDLLRQAKANGVPFDGIGIQAHEPRHMRFPLDRVWSILDSYAILNKELHITEFTPCSGGQPIIGSHMEGKWDENSQADYAEKFYQVCFAHPKMAAITWWDFCDQGSWQKGGGMLREDLRPKPVYTALKKLIHQEWHSSAQGKTNASGLFRFRGFYGRYQVKVEFRGKSIEAEMHLVKGDSKISVLKLP